VMHWGLEVAHPGAPVWPMNKVLYGWSIYDAFHIRRAGQKPYIHIRTCDTYSVFLAGDFYMYGHTRQEFSVWQKNYACYNLIAQSTS
jgi:hypothetical protein